MEHRLTLFKGADMAKNLFQHFHDLGRILPHPAGIVGI